MSTFRPTSELIAWIGLRRVHAGGVGCVAGCWVQHGRRVPCYLPAVLDDLTEAGLIALADGPHGPLARASLTDTGHARYTALLGRYGAFIARAELDVPGPEFPERVSPTGDIETPADCRLSDPRPTAPGDRLGPIPPVGGLRWARDPHDGHLRSVRVSDLLLAQSRGYTGCWCGHKLPADVATEDRPSGALCLPCVIGVTAGMTDPGHWDAPL